MKKYVIPIIVAVLIIVGTALLISQYSKRQEKPNPQENQNTQNNTNQNTNTNTNNTNSSEKAILYFYSDSCHWCQQQKPIVQELENEGVKFKYMDVGENRDLINQYNISGTPTFIYGEKRLEGYNNKEALKKFWQENVK